MARRGWSWPDQVRPAGFLASRLTPPPPPSLRSGRGTWTEFAAFSAPAQLAGLVRRGCVGLGEPEAAELRTVNHPRARMAR